MNRIITISILLLFSCTGEKPKNLGIKDGKLAPCPDKPNCVSTFSDSEEHKITSLNYNCTDSLAMQFIESAIKEYGSSKITLKDSIYIHAEFTTTIGWADDVEFMLDTKRKLIHFRSASRYGHSDFGTNRERYEELTALIKSKVL